MRPSTPARLRIAAVLVVGVIVQTSVGADLRVAGVAPDLLLLLAICGGLVGGPVSGALIGFGAGLLADLTMTTTPLGLTALSWCLVGWGVGALRAGWMPEGRALQPILAFLATLGGVTVFLLVGELVGQRELVAPGRSYLVSVALIEGLWNAVLVVPSTFLLERAARGSKGAAGLRGRDSTGIR